MKEEKKKSWLDPRKLMVILISTLCVALVVAAIILFSPRKTAPIDRFCRALQKGSYIELQKCMPKEAWETASAMYNSDATRPGTFVSELNLIVTETKKALTETCGDKLKITYTVKDKKDYDNEKLGRLAQYLSEKFGLDVDAVTEACELLVDTTSKGTKAKQVDENDLYIVYKYNEEWYLYFDPLSGT